MQIHVTCYCIILNDAVAIGPAVLNTLPMGKFAYTKHHLIPHIRGSAYIKLVLDPNNYPIRTYVTWSEKRDRRGFSFINVEFSVWMDSLFCIEYIGEGLN